MVASVTFILGIGVTSAANLPLNLTIALVAFLGVPIIASSIVVYQGAWLQKPWRPAIGKAFLATFIWLFPSLIVVVGNLIAYLDSLDPQPLFQYTFRSSVVLFLLNGTYAFIGWTLCRWVRRYDAGNHFLLRNDDYRCL